MLKLKGSGYGPVKGPRDLDRSPLENFKDMNENSPEEQVRADENFDDIEDERKMFDSNL